MIFNFECRVKSARLLKQNKIKQRPRYPGNIHGSFKGIGWKWVLGIDCL